MSYSVFPIGKMYQK